MAFKCYLNTVGLTPINLKNTDVMYRNGGENSQNLNTDHGPCMTEDGTVMWCNLLERCTFSKKWGYFTSGFGTNGLNQEQFNKLCDDCPTMSVDLEDDTAYLNRMNRLVTQLKSIMTGSTYLICMQEFPNGPDHRDGADACYTQICEMFNSAFADFNLHIRGNNALMVRKDVPYTYVENPDEKNLTSSKLQLVIVGDTIFANVHLNWASSSDKEKNEKEFVALTTIISSAQMKYFGGNQCYCKVLGDFNRENHTLKDTNDTIGIHAFSDGLANMLNAVSYVLFTCNDFTNFRMMENECVYTSSDYLIMFTLSNQNIVTV